MSHHHHFFDEKDGRLIDINETDVGPIDIQTKIPGKKIKSIEVFVKLEDQ